MLFIMVRVEAPDVCLPTEYRWHVDDALPFPSSNVEFVVEVQADGHELELILFRYPGLPHVLRDIPGSKVQRWFGDQAKFIVANLPVPL